MVDSALALLRSESRGLATEPDALMPDIACIIGLGPAPGTISGCASRCIAEVVDVRNPILSDGGVCA